MKKQQQPSASIKGLMISNYANIVLETNHKKKMRLMASTLWMLATL